MHASRRWAYYTLTPIIPVSVSPVAPDLVTMGLNERQIAAFRYVQQHGEITTRTYVEKIAPQITERMARKDLKALQERGLVRRVGRTRGTKYVVLVPNSSE